MATIVVPASAAATAKTATQQPQRLVSFARLAWVAPLTVAACVAVNLGIKTLALALSPSLSHMGQLGEPLIKLTLEGSIAAVVAFALMALVLPRPFMPYRVLGAAALLASLIPDVALGLGGSAAMSAMRVVSPLAMLGSAPPAGGPGGPGGRSGPPAGFVMPGAPLEQVLVLVLLHVATAAVCVALLTTLPRRSQPAPTVEE